MAPRASIHVLLIDFQRFGGRRRAKALWLGVVGAIICFIWMERNARIFEDRFGSVDLMWDRVHTLASFWALVSPSSGGVLLFLISKD